MVTTTIACWNHETEHLDDQNVNIHTVIHTFGLGGVEQHMKFPSCAVFNENANVKTQHIKVHLRRRHAKLPPIFNQLLLKF